MTEEIIDETPAKRGGQLKLLIALILGAGLAAFIVQNTESTPVTWLVFDRSAPLWVVIVTSAAVGAILSEVAGWLIRRGRRS